MPAEPMQLTGAKVNTTVWNYVIFENGTRLESAADLIFLRIGKSKHCNTNRHSVTINNVVIFYFLWWKLWRSLIFKVSWYTAEGVNCCFHTLFFDLLLHVVEQENMSVSSLSQILVVCGKTMMQKMMMKTRRMKDLQDSYFLILLHPINMVPSTLPVFHL